MALDVTEAPSSLLLSDIAKVDNSPLWALHSSQCMSVVLTWPLFAPSAIEIAMPGNFSHWHWPLAAL